MSVVVFSAPWCAGCKVVKKALDNADVIYEEVNIDNDEGMQKAKELGIRNIPVIYVGDFKFVGSKPETIKEILEAVGD